MLGPDTDVNDTMRAAEPCRLRYSQIPTEPQSWASTCTGASGLTASITAEKSSAKRSIVYADVALGTSEAPAPRLS